MGLSVLQFDIVRIKSQKRANMIVNVAGLLILARLNAVFAVFVFTCSGVRGFVFTCVREMVCVYAVFTGAWM